jgi:endonuclease/exonuclease/phosphatase family metal-dependent hydrolase
MKRGLFLVGFVAVSNAIGGHARGLATEPVRIRVMTYNIHHGEGTDHEFDLQRLAQIITAADPDLVALQEVDRSTARSGGVDQLSELGKLTGMHTAFGKAMAFQGGAYGVGVLSRFAIRDVRNDPLPDPPDFEPRTALTVAVQVKADGPVIHFTSTHFDSGRDLGNRTIQAEYVNRLSAREYPSILAGDMNARTDSEPLQILGLQWANASPPDPRPADPAARWFGRVDYVLLRPANYWRVMESTVIDAPVASDHLPVVADLASVTNVN